jgi:hypothetical protein
MAPPPVRWVALRVQGPLDFTLTGIVAELSRCLAAALVSVFVVSTYDTDYLLVREGDLPLCWMHGPHAVPGRSTSCYTERRSC